MNNNILIKDKLWTKQYIGMIALSFFISVSLNMSGTITPLYAQYLGGDFSTIGLVMAFFTVSALIFRPLFGILLDKMGRKAVIIGGGVLFSIATLTYGIAFSVVGLLILRFFHGMGFSAHSTASGTVISDIVPSSRLTEGVGYFGIAQTLSMAIGPVIGLSVAGNRGYNTVFIIAASLSAVSVLIACTIGFKNHGLKVIPNQHLSENKRSIKDAVIEKSVIPTALILFFIALTFGAVLTFLPAYAISKGVGDIGIFFTVFALVQLIVRPLTGKIADKFGFSSIMLPGLGFLAISMMLLAFSENLAMFIAAGITYGTGFGSVQPTLNAIMIKFCPPERRGVGNATFFSAMDIGIGLGAIVWGIISRVAGFQIVYIACAVCVIAAAVLHVFWLDKQIKSNNNVNVTVDAPI